MAHLKVEPREDRPGTFEITGTVPGYKRTRKTAKANTRNGTSYAQAFKLAKEEAAALEARMLRESFHGPAPDSRADRTFSQIAEEYLAPKWNRHPAMRARVLAVAKALNNMRANAVNQAVVDGLVGKMIQKEQPSPHTIRAFVTTPISVVLNFGWRREWCDKPRPFERPRERIEKRPKILLPSEALRLIEELSSRQRPIVKTMFCIGARVRDALGIEWPNVDLRAGKASFIQKRGRWRHVELPPALVTEWANLPGQHDTGKLFAEYATTAKTWNGGQLKTGFDGALRRAGLDGRGITPHTCRHSYASWHYAIWRNALKLQEDGGWDGDARTLKVYMHLMPEGHEAEILKFWGYAASDTRLTPTIRDILLSA